MRIRAARVPAGAIDSGRRSAHPTRVRQAVLHVVPYFHPAWSYGGIPRLVYGLARQQVRDGHRVTVVTTDALSAEGRAGGAGHVAEVDGIRVARFPNLSNRLAYRHQLFLPAGAGAYLRRHAGDHDIVHLHGHRHLLENLAVAAAARAGVPVVMTPNGTLPVLERKPVAKRVWDVLLGDRVLDRCALFLAVSRAEVAQLRRAGISADRLRLVPNGIELEEFERPPPRGSFRAAHRLGDARVVLYLGKLTPRKGVDHLIRAFAARRTADAHLVIAGNDMTGVGPALRRLRDELGLRERVHFVGLVVGPERLEALVDADVLVYPSEHEIFGLVPFEGLLCGTPVVVGDDCGCGELVSRAGAGFLVPYGDAVTLAERIETLLADPAAGDAMVRRGRAFIARHFAWPEVAARTAEAYELARSRFGNAPRSGYKNGTA